LGVATGIETPPESVKKLIDSRSFASVATLMPGGSPHVTQTWIDREGDIVMINTFEGSQKHRNGSRDPRIALTVVDQKNEFNVAIIRGRVKEVTLEGAEEHIDKMAMKYNGLGKYERWFPQRRVLIKIEPRRVIPPWTDTSRSRASNSWVPRVRVDSRIIVACGAEAFLY
jgi:PPOX class probable F420-dependent enzyme